MSIAKAIEKCPFCKEPIISGAVRCKHCHADLKPVGTKKPSRLAKLNTFRVGFVSGLVFSIVLAILYYLQFYTSK
jgi:hypothetical protein